MVKEFQEDQCFIITEESSTSDFAQPEPLDFQRLKMVTFQVT